ncbi:MAG: hypothetical protein ACK5LC_06155 [Coprobacillaceae bacterium]
MKLYRPVGLYEMEKNLNTKGTAFSAPLPEQPIFYSVLNKEYAQQIAENWNTKDESSGFSGFVTEFNIEEEFIKQYSVKNVGGNLHSDYWIPANEMKKFNAHLIGRITVTDAFYGRNYNGIIPEGITGFKEINPIQQIDNLNAIRNYNPLDFSGTVSVEWKIMNLNYIYWLSHCSEYSNTIMEISKCLIKNNLLFINYCK